MKFATIHHLCKISEVLWKIYFKKKNILYRINETNYLN